jgi:hypothetical protein
MEAAADDENTVKVAGAALRARVNVGLWHEADETYPRASNVPYTPPHLVR